PSALPHRRGDQPVGHRARPVRHRHADRDPRYVAARGDAGGRAHRRFLLLPARRRLGLRLPQAPAGHAARGGAALQRLAQGHLYGGRRAARRAGRRRGRRTPGAGADRPRPHHARRRQASARHDGVRQPGGVRRAPGSMTLLRSSLFALALLLITPPYAVIALATFPLPRMMRYRIISGWSRLVVLLAKVVLGIDWKVEGWANLPSRPAVILSKHQSAWETLAFQAIFPPQVLVLKRELLWIPFFGWGL